MPVVSGTTVSGISPPRKKSTAAAAPAIALLLAALPASAGSYTSFNGGAGPDTPIPVGSITKWATTVSNYAPAPGLGPNFRNSAATSGVFSLGDLYSTTAQPTVGSEPSAFHAGSGTANFHPYGGNVNDTTDTYGFIGIDAPGSVTFYYETGIFNGTGADLAVRENGFATGPAPGFFAELAFVEVSSNGTDFARFPSISLNTTTVSVSGTFQAYDMTNVYNLAGKHASNLATPFDLQDLTTHELVLGGTVNLSNIKYVRLVDVVGNPASSGTAGAVDSLGNRILDNWTTYDSGGFDISIVGGLPQAVGVLNAIPEPAVTALGLASVLPLLRRRRKP